MAKRSRPAARKVRPYVFVFSLGAGAKVGKRRVPAAFAVAPCYFYRSDQEAHAHVLDALPEPSVPEPQVDLVLEAIDALVERCDLRAELYTDLELEEDAAWSELRGFHAGAGAAEVTAALERGGFVIARDVEPGAVRPKAAAALARGLEALERHLDLTDLGLVNQRIDEGAELPRHASAAALVVTDMLASQAKAFTARVQIAATTWHADWRDTLLTLVAVALKAAPTRELQTLLAGLPEATYPITKARLASAASAMAELDEKAKSVEPAPQATKATKATKPTDTDAARIARIEAAARQAKVRLPKGASEAAIAAAEAALGVALPDEVRAFYRAHDGGPSGKLACGGRELLSLKGVVGQWKMYKAAFDAGELEDDDIEPAKGVQSTCWNPAWIPFTYDFGGNHHVIDLAPAKRGTRGQIVSVWHDDPTREVEAASFLAWLEGQTWAP